MADRKRVEEIARGLGYDSVGWIQGDEVETGRWVRAKCTFACDGYSKSASCPPSTPPVEECRELFDEYSDVLIVHFIGRFDNPADRKPWTKNINKKLLELERAIFLEGYYKALLLFMDECAFCKDCTGSVETCLQPALSRPSGEGMAMDVFATVRKAGFPISVLTETGMEMNRYAFVLVD